MITEDERFIEIQGILANSDISTINCAKINDLIIELSKEKKQLQQENQELNGQLKKQKEVIDKAIEYIRIYRSYQKIDNKDYLKGRDEIGCLDIYQVDELLDILKEVSE